MQRVVKASETIRVNPEPCTKLCLRSPLEWEKAELTFISVALTEARSEEAFRDVLSDEVIFNLRHGG